jgi:hypothetical protein
MRGLDLRSIYLQEKFGQERGRTIAKKKWARGSSPICVKLKASHVPDAVQRGRQRSGAPLIRDLREGRVPALHCALDIAETRESERP